ncbi:MAG: TldD/PmbA family protein [Spirochaetes bacterium]|nr:TldD/PmbA family protein [Spirochaetota bacterium]
MIERVQDRLSGRARWFDIIEVSGSSTPISFKNNRLHSITERHNTGFGVRVNVDGRTGFSYTNDGAALDDMAGRAMELSTWGDREDFELPAEAGTHFEPYDGAIDSFDVKSEIAAAEETIAAILARFPGATVDLGISRSTASSRIVNSSGIDASYRSSHYAASIGATLILDDGSRIEAAGTLSGLAPLDYRELRDEITGNIEAALTTRKSPSGRVPVVLSPRAAARIIGIVTSGLNAKSVYRGISPFAERRGSAVFNSALTLRDDPSMDSSPFSYPFDDEGVPAVKKRLVNRGVIETFITDLKHAKKLGLAAGGNGQRSYASLPYPSFSNIVIDPGIEPRNRMIEGIERGILVEQFIGLGQSNTLTGDFSANLELAYLIENGTITGRVKDCMLSDNLFHLLAGEIVLSAERKRIGSVLAPYIMLPAVNYTG